MTRYPGAKFSGLIGTDKTGWQGGICQKVWLKMSVTTVLLADIKLVTLYILNMQCADYHGASLLLADSKVFT